MVLIVFTFIMFFDYNNFLTPKKVPLCSVLYQSTWGLILMILDLWTFPYNRLILQILKIDFYLQRLRYILKLTLNVIYEFQKLFFLRLLHADFVIATLMISNSPSYRQFLIPWRFDSVCRDGLPCKQSPLPVACLDQTMIDMFHQQWKTLSWKCLTIFIMKFFLSRILLNFRMSFEFE